MSLTEKNFKEFQDSELKPGDTFQFECSMCGNCCRNRREPILLTGTDIFRVAHGLGTSVESIVLQNTQGYVGESSHVPALVLRERFDGSCSFLRKGRCMVQQYKPSVCALYPLGRYFDARDNSFHYFFNQNTCQCGKDTGQKWTLQKWLDKFNIEETEVMTAAWHKLLIGITQETCKISKDKITGEMIDALYRVLYLNYDIEKPYVEQIRQNMYIAQCVLGSEFHMRITF